MIAVPQRPESRAGAWAGSSARTEEGICNKCGEAVGGVSIEDGGACRAIISKCALPPATVKPPPEASGELAP